jgi:hypothetical protein
MALASCPDFYEQTWQKYLGEILIPYYDELYNSLNPVLTSAG